MAKQAAIEFDKRLHKLFDDRTHWLRAQVRKSKPGPAPQFSKKKVKSSIKKLQTLATKCLLRSYAVDGLDELYNQKKQWHVTGWGVDQKQRAFVRWFEKTIHYKNCVYVFWAKRRCRYVGRTLKGKNRPQGQFQKFWFPGVTRIDIYAARGRKDVPKLECLATHRFKPTRSKNKPAARKWTAKCPICEAHKAIQSEVKSIFRLR